MCFCTTISVSTLSLSFFVVVTAVLEGVHFNFGSRPVLILFQLLNLVLCAVPILLFFGYFTNKLRTKKNAPTIWITFLIEVHAALIVCCSHSNFVFSLEVVLLFLLWWHPCCITSYRGNVVLLLRSWANSSLCSLSTSAGVMDQQNFLFCRVALLLLLSKAFFCCLHHPNDL